LAAALQVVKPKTHHILVEDEYPYAVAASTPLPETPYNPTAVSRGIVPAAQAKVSDNAGWGGFPGPAV